ncbi:hypothetical protein TRIUR3_10350 [Triticum urartu]|uniref:Uncharacterized protein n=1 Tax=Triticum urartu TaxID=4572 RepID=M7YCV4_TRIUA|nr:hypothetical protein TRIUR3_10350 [Triticum urartu]
MEFLYDCAATATAVVADVAAALAGTAERYRSGQLKRALCEAEANAFKLVQLIEYISRLASSDTYDSSHLTHVLVVLWANIGGAADGVSRLALLLNSGRVWDGRRRCLIQVQLLYSRNENLMVILYIGATTSGSSSDALYKELYGMLALGRWCFAKVKEFTTSTWTYGTVCSSKFLSLKGTDRNGCIM